MGWEDISETPISPAMVPAHASHVHGCLLFDPDREPGTVFLVYKYHLI